MIKVPIAHEIKILPQYFRSVVTTRKRFEIRKDDRNYQAGDIVTLREWKQDEGYTGNEITITITYVLRNCPQFGLMDGYCIFGW